jgi:hypothetical protein
MLDAGCQMLDAGCWILDATKALILPILGQGVGGRIEYLESKIQYRTGGREPWAGGP